jgi:hypothetical protein
MTVRHIEHLLTCRECQDAHRRDPPDPPRDGQCALELTDDRNPPVRCPHPSEDGSQWCDVHTEAILAAAARTAAQERAAALAVNKQLAARLTDHDRGIARMRDLLRQVDEAIRQGEEGGLSDIELLPHRLNRDHMASYLEDMLAGNQAASAWLDGGGALPPAG